MNVRLLRGCEQEIWNEFVLARRNGHFMQSWEWGGLKESQGWKPFFAVVEDNGSIVGGALVLRKRLPVIGKSLLYSPCGPLIPYNDKQVLLELCRQIQLVAIEEKAVFWRIDPYDTSEETGTAFRDAGFREVPMEWSYWNAPKYLMHLDLTDVPEMFAQMGSTARNEVRQAVKNGVTVEYGGVGDLDEFFSLMVTTADKKKILHHDISFYRTIFENLGKKGMVQLFLARNNEKTGSAGISVRFGETAWLLYLASNYTIKFSNRALQWEMVKWAIDSGCKRYDFRGTATNFPPSESDPGYGVYKFKKSFGADVAIMAGYYDFVYSPASYRFFRLAEHSLLPRVMDLRSMIQ